jgi:hypothetical protein
MTQDYLVLDRCNGFTIAIKTFITFWGSQFKFKIHISNYTFKNDFSTSSPVFADFSG